MIKTYDLSTVEGVTQFTLAVVGEEKTGKSWLAASSRKPILYWDFDGRWEAIPKERRDGIYVVTNLVDPPFSQSQTVLPTIYDMITCLEKSKKVRELLSGALRFFPNAPPDLEFKTVVVDSGQALSRCNLNYILAGSDSIRYATMVGGQAVAYTPKGWTGWTADTTNAERILLRLIATGLDVIFILHEEEDKEREQGSTSDEPKYKYTGKIGPYPARYRHLLSHFNEVWRMTLVPGATPETRGRLVPRVRVAQDYKFNSSTCLKLDNDEEPDIQKMLAKHALRLSGVKP